MPNYSNSSLVTYKKLSDNCTKPRNHKIDTISIHCIVGQWTARQGCDYFAGTSRSASCNYVVGKDGSIGLCVEEKNRSWCTSSASNDHRAITIEVASDTTHPYAVTTKAYNALIKLLVDICKRNGIKKLLWKADKSLIGQVDKQNMTVHRWFASKACPGDYLYSRHGKIADAVNKQLSGGSEEPDTPGPTPSMSNDEHIWNYFMQKIGNEKGVAGLMGNLYSESGLHPDRVQGDIPYSSYSKEYTKKVDNGTISKNDFVHNGPNGGGYGLAQWTFWSRKQGLYEMWKSGGYSSIGSIELACDYLWKELSESYSGVVNTLKTTTSIRTASDKVLHDFERPADQSTAVEEKREEWSIYYYNKFAGSNDYPSGDDHSGNNRPEQKYVSNLLFLAMATDRF